MEVEAVMNDDVIELNIGGEKMATKRLTLCQVEGSLLATMFSGRWENNLARDKDGRIFLDVNPKYFSFILDYLREKKISSPESLIPMPRFSSNEVTGYKSLVRYLGLEDELLIPKVPEPERFDLYAEGITLSENGAVATTNGHRDRLLQHVFGTNIYERGRYRLKIQLGSFPHHGFGPLGYYCVGIIKNDVLLGNPALTRIDFGYGWGFDHNGFYTYVKAVATRTAVNFSREGDIFELMLDCDAAMLYINFPYGRQFDVNLPKYSKYRLHVVLPNFNSTIRIVQLHKE